MKSHCLLSISLLLAASCKSTPAEPEPNKEAPSKTPSTAAPAVTAAPVEKPVPAAAPSPRPARPVANVPVMPDDPLKGSFSIADAMQGIAGFGQFVATIDTDLGKLDCKLFG